MSSPPAIGRGARSRWRLRGLTHVLAIVAAGAVAYVLEDGRSIGQAAILALAAVGCVVAWALNQRLRAESGEARRRTLQQAAVAELGQHAMDGMPSGELAARAVRLAAGTVGASHARLHATSSDGEQLFDVSVGEQPAPATEPAIALDFDQAGNGSTGAFALYASRGAFHHSDTPFVRALTSIVSNACSRERDASDLRHLSLHDVLTGLPNRSLFLDRLQQALVGATGQEERVSVLFLDVDHFKTINDTLGHEAGDQLLEALAPRLRAALQPADTLARFGGDEFVILSVSGEPVLALAERIEAAFAETFQLGVAEMSVTASIGVVVGHSRYAGDPAAILRDADTAMYRAKAHGRGRVELFDEVLRSRMLRRLRIEQRLRRAMERDELELHYQPLIRLSDGVIACAEALLRWHDEELGWVGPAEFVPIAEENGLIVPLGEWVLRQACLEVARWPEIEPDRPRVMVNLSPVQVARPDLVETVQAALSAAGVRGQRLVLEITESTLMRHPERAAEQLRTCEELGVRLALDDFGTGYSSLAAIKQFPLDAIKLDRSFIAGLPGEPQDSAIVRAVVEMARTLDLRVIAEGVEREEQVEALAGLGCELAQGYVFARPMPAPQFRTMLGKAVAAMPSAAA